MLSKKILSAFVTLTLVVGLCPGLAYADDMQLQSASIEEGLVAGQGGGSVNEEPITNVDGNLDKGESVISMAASAVAERLQDLKAVLPMQDGDSERNYGHVSDGFEVPSIHDANEKEPAMSAAESLPAAYDSRDHNLVTPVKDQSYFGVCWAFAAASAMESSALADSLVDSVDISERHLAYFTYHSALDALGNTAGDATIPYDETWSDRFGVDPYLETGGNSFLVMCALAAWKGASDEVLAPYSELCDAYLAARQYYYENYETVTYEETLASFLASTALSADIAFNDIMHMQGYREVPLKDAADVKAAIMERGSVSAAVYYSTDSQYYNSETNALYYTGTPRQNHDVTIVGWDDSYSRENFIAEYDPFPTGGGSQYPSSPTTILEGETSDDVRLIIRDGEVHPDRAWFKFSPETDGRYRFDASVNGAELDTLLYKMQEDDNLSAAGGDVVMSDDGSAAVTADLKAGSDYYLRVKILPIEGSESGSFNVTVKRTGDTPSTKPASDGAWLMKNSHGQSSNDNGYFWVSYEDKGLSSASFYLMDAADNYDNNYQYDGSSGRCINLIESGGAIANVFEAKANPSGCEQLKAVSFMLDDVNVDYSVQVFINLRDAADPTSGTPALATPITGSTDYCGYYTVELPKPVTLREGSKYAVVVTMSHADGSRVMYDVDATCGRGAVYADSWPWASFQSAVQFGQSYERDTATSGWDDLASDECDTYVINGEETNDEPNCCARLKAFTDNVEGDGKANLPIEEASVMVDPTSVVYSDQVARPAVSVEYGGVVLAEGTDYTLSYDGRVDAGESAITVKGAGDFAGETQVAFDILPCPIDSISVVEHRYVYDGSAKKPDVVVKAAGNVVPASGYDVTYANNTAIGEASATVVAKGNYTGTLTVTFTIAKAAHMLAAFSGETRYETARMIVDAAIQEGYAKGAVIVAGDGQKFPDALSAAGLASILDYPIVMVDGTQLNSENRVALENLKKANGGRPLDLVIVGGTAAVSSSVERSLKSWGNVSKRLDGATRYETNAMVYEQGKKAGSWSTDTVFLARGDMFPDALAIAPYLVWSRAPIVLVNPKETSAANLSKSSREAISNAGQVVALGGTSAVTAALLNSAKSSSKGKMAWRLWGEDRYMTASAIARWEVESGMTLNNAGIATGQNFPDALTSGFLLGKTGSALCLVSPTASANDSLLVLLKEYAASIDDVRVFGGSGAVTPSMRKLVTNACGWGKGYAVEEQP